MDRDFASMFSTEDPSESLLVQGELDCNNVSYPPGGVRLDGGPGLRWNIAIILLDYLFIVVAIFGNTLTIMAYVKFPSLHNPTSLLICNQSIADAVACMTGQVFIWFNYTSWGLEVGRTNKYACLVSMWGILLSLSLSLFNLLALSAERLLCIAFSYQYYRWVTDTSVRVLIGVLWVVILSTSSFPLLGWNTWKPGNTCLAVEAYSMTYYMYMFLVPSLLALVLITVCNVAICVIAFSKRQVTPQPVTVVQSTPGSLSTGKQYKITKMLLLVVGVFYISWMPHLIMNSIISAPPASWRMRGTPHWVSVVPEFAKGLLGVNAAANPLIYAWKNSQFRTAFGRILGLKPKLDTEMNSIQSTPLA